MNTNYSRNKARAIFTNTQPSMTDQASAKATDVNHIVKTYAVTNQVPGGAKPPMHGVDFTELPPDYRGMIELARSLARNMNKLPPALRGLTPEQLLALTPEQLTAKLAPPAPAPADPKEETK